MSEAAGGGGLFYRGLLLRFARGTGAGTVRSAATGREVPFDLIHVQVLGEKGPAGLREGAAVGYDVGWTSRGLRVTKLFPIEEGSDAPAPEVVVLKEEDSSGT